jgi:hypothetical protein
LAVGADGKRVAWLRHTDLMLGDVTWKGQALATVNIPDANRLRRLAFAAKAPVMAAALELGAIDIWDLDSNKHWQIPVTSAVRLSAIALSPDGRNLIASVGPALRMWDVTTGHKAAHYDLDPWRASAVDLASEGRRIVIRVPGYNFRGTIYDVCIGQSLSSFVSDGLDWRSVFSPNGHALLVAETVRKGIPQSATAHIGSLTEIHTGSSRVSFPLQARQCVAMAFSARTRLVALVEDPADVHLFDIATGEKLGCFTAAPDSAVSSVALSDDGKRLITVIEDGPVLLWDVAAISRPPKDLTPTSLTASDLEILWQHLAAEQTERAYGAMWKLAGAPRQAVSFLSAKLKGRAVGSKQIDALIADLDSPQYGTRERATNELVLIGKPTVPALRTASMPGASLEKSMRIQLILKKINSVPVSWFQIRDLRAVEVLEMIGSSDALPVLEALTKGLPQAPLTFEAEMAVRRIRQNQAAAIGPVPN